MDSGGSLRLFPLRRGLAIYSTVDIFTFYVPHRHVYGEQWIKFMKDGVNATPLPTVNTTGYIDHAAFLGTINPDTSILSKTDALDEEKWLNMLGTFVKDWFRYESHFVHGRDSLVDILKERGLLSESDAVQPLIGKKS